MYNIRTEVHILEHFIIFYRAALILWAHIV